MINLKKFKKKITDLILYFLLIPSCFAFLVYKKRGPKNAPIATALLRKIGVFPILNHYYDPQFKFTSEEIKSLNIRKLFGINLNIEFQLNFLSRLKYNDELIALNFQKNK